MAAGINPKDFKCLFHWFAKSVDAQQWMGELRMAGIGNRTAGKDVDKQSNCASLFRETWVPFYNKHHKDQKIKFEQSALLTRSSVVSTEDVAAISRAYSEAKKNSGQSDTFMNIHVEHLHLNIFMNINT